MTWMHSSASRARHVAERGQTEPQNRCQNPVWNSLKYGMRRSFGYLKVAFSISSFYFAIPGPFSGFVVRSANGVLCATLGQFKLINTRRDRPVPLAKITELLSSSLVSSFSLVSSTSHSRMLMRVREHLSLSVSRTGTGSSRCAFLGNFIIERCVPVATVASSTIATHSLVQTVLIGRTI
jgi:hypothetical protein